MPSCCIWRQTRHQEAEFIAHGFLWARAQQKAGTDVLFQKVSIIPRRARRAPSFAQLAIPSCLPDLR